MNSSSHVQLLDVRGNSINDRILGRWMTGVVVERNGLAFKQPACYSLVGSENQPQRFAIQSQIARESLNHEKNVYQRLGSIEGVVACFDVSEVGIVLEMMNNGTPREYLTHNRPTRRTQLQWLRDIAATLMRIHERCVLVADIASRNLLITSDGTIKFADFSEASLLNTDSDMEKVDDSGYSIYTDIGQTGAVFFEIMTGTSCNFDLYKTQPPGPAKAIWPKREDLPRTDGVWLGGVIDACWKKTFANGGEILRVLNLVVLD